MDKRDPRLDILRIGACFSLLPFHFCEYGIRGESDYISTFIKSLSEYHIPIFLMITGVLFFSRKQIDVKRLYTHNILHLLFVYLFWSTIYAVFDVLINLQNVTGFWDLMKWVILDIRDGHYHLWYIPMIMGIYIIIPVVHAAIGDGKNRGLLKYSVAVFVIFGVIIPTLLMIPIGYDTYSIMLNKVKVELFAGYFGYTLVGYFLYRNREKITSGIRRVLVVMAILAVVVVETGNLSHVAEEGVNTFFLYFPVPCFIVEITLFVLLNRIDPDRLKVSRQFLADVADCMLGVYCIHDLVMSVVIMAMGFIPENLFILRLVLAISISFVISTCIVMLMRKSRILKRIAV